LQIIIDGFINDRHTLLKRNVAIHGALFGMKVI
jgi:hypothetical protein